MPISRVGGGGDGQKGQRGDKGPGGGAKGDIGPKGPQGDKGVAGADGSIGPKGDKGDLGLSGPTGSKGPPGGAGPKGNRGDKGDRGPTGSSGNPGQKGGEGEKGSTGSTGSKGQKGEPGTGGGGGGGGGTKGQKGDTGSTGRAGTDGTPGRKGDEGDPGAPGTAGQKGDRGSKGQKGDSGTGGGGSGSKGQKGAAGSPGSPGSDGLKGDKGDVGPEGPKGDRGSAGTGTKGQKGEPGTGGGGGGGSGAKGQKGDTGSAGSDGSKGQKGESGTGTDGAKGQKGQRGTAGSGTKGQKGDTGSKGVPGSAREGGALGRLVGTATVAAITPTRADILGTWTLGSVAGVTRVPYSASNPANSALSLNTYVPFSDGVMGLAFTAKSGNTVLARSFIPWGPSPDDGVGREFDSIYVGQVSGNDRRVSIEWDATGGSHIGLVAEEGDALPAFTIECHEWIAVGGKGQKGTAGTAGATGTDGAKGQKGTTGAGTKGQKGDTGSKGSAGSKGEEGSRGNDGIGQKGRKGDSGTDGTDGQKGAQGTAGTDGAKGQKGEPGAGGKGGGGGGGQKGQKGDTGTAGTDGAKGNTGSKGTAGSKGQKGEQGEEGPSGPKGNRGTAGTHGTDGAKGHKGEVGPKGNTGTGTAGSDGAKGQKGTTGSKGQRGQRGAAGTGTKGQKGEPGTGGGGGAGTKGQKGTSGQKGTAGQKGAAGEKGQKGGGAGDKGQKGNAGSKGIPGSSSPAGSMGRLISIGQAPIQTPASGDEMNVAWHRGPGVSGLILTEFNKLGLGTVIPWSDAVMGLVFTMKIGGTVANGVLTGGTVIGRSYMPWRGSSKQSLVIDDYMLFADPDGTFDPINIRWTKDTSTSMVSATSEISLIATSTGTTEDLSYAAFTMEIHEWIAVGAKGDTGSTGKKGDSGSKGQRGSGGIARKLVATSNDLPTGVGTIGADIAGVVWTLADGASDAHWESSGNELHIPRRGHTGDPPVGLLVELEQDGTVVDKGTTPSISPSEGQLQFTLHSTVVGTDATSVQVSIDEASATPSITAVVLQHISRIQPNTRVKVYQLTAITEGTQQAAGRLVARGVLPGNAVSHAATAANQVIPVAWTATDADIPLLLTTANTIGLNTILPWSDSTVGLIFTMSIGGDVVGKAFLPWGEATDGTNDVVRVLQFLNGTRYDSLRVRWAYDPSTSLVVDTNKIDLRADYAVTIPAFTFDVHEWVSGGGIGAKGSKGEAGGGGGAALATDAQFLAGSSTVAPTVNQAKSAANAASSIFVGWFGDANPTVANPFDPTFNSATLAAYATTAATTLFDETNLRWTLHRDGVATGRGKIGPLYWDDAAINFRRFAALLLLRSEAIDGNAGWNDFFWGASDGDLEATTDSWAGTNASGAFVRIKRVSATQMAAALRIRHGSGWSYIDNSDSTRANLRNGTKEGSLVGTSHSITIPLATTDTDDYLVHIVSMGRDIALYINKICWVVWTIPHAWIPGQSGVRDWGPRFGLFPDAGPSVTSALSSSLKAIVLGAPDPLNIDPDGRFSNSLSATSLSILDFGSLEELTALADSDDIMVFDESASRLKRIANSNFTGGGGGAKGDPGQGITRTLIATSSVLPVTAQADDSIFANQTWTIESGQTSTAAANVLTLQPPADKTLVFLGYDVTLFEGTTIIDRSTVPEFGNDAKLNGTGGGGIKLDFEVNEGDHRLRLRSSGHAITAQSTIQVSHLTVTAVGSKGQKGAPGDKGQPGVGGGTTILRTLRATSSTMSTSSFADNTNAGLTWTIAAAAGGWQAISARNQLRLPRPVGDRLILGVELVLMEGTTVRDRILIGEQAAAALSSDNQQKFQLHGGAASRDILKIRWNESNGVNQLQFETTGNAPAASTTIEVYERSI